jgi:hypothetical protein
MPVPVGGRQVTVGEALEEYTFAPNTVATNLPVLMPGDFRSLAFNALFRRYRLGSVLI